MKNILKNSLCYLCGPIDNAADQGKTWRTETIKRYKKMNIKFLDPTNKLRGLVKEVDDEQEKIRKYKREGRWEELSKMMKGVVHQDLRVCDYVDFMIAYVDTSIHMCGSYHEIITATIQKKPVFIVVEGGKKNASSWLFGICDHNYMFDNFDELYKYLDGINSGKIKLSDRWVLIRNQLQTKKVIK